MPSQTVIGDDIDDVIEDVIHSLGKVLYNCKV